MLHAIKLLKHDIFGLEVSVNHTFTVSGAECLCHLAHERGYARLLHSATLHHRTQIAAFDKLEHDEGFPLRRLACIEDADNAWMIYAGKGLDLFVELFSKPRIVGRVRHLVE